MREPPLIVPPWLLSEVEEMMRLPLPYKASTRWLGTPGNSTLFTTVEVDYALWETQFRFDAWMRRLEQTT